ncbi:MAG: nuclear transport factor 2 family protein [bacterium]|nr:nuclear transport factor 2 family protein [bacterium]
MNRKKFQHWLEKLGKAWSGLNPEAAAHLFSKDVEYYESATKSPCESWDNVSDLWKIISTNQKDVAFDFDILAVSKNICVANWRVKRVLLPQNTKQKIDGIFVFKLDEDGLCNYFKQWRTIENI